MSTLRSYLKSRAENDPSMLSSDSSDRFISESEAEEDLQSLEPMSNSEDCLMQDARSSASEQPEVTSQHGMDSGNAAGAPIGCHPEMQAEHADDGQPLPLHELPSPLERNPFGQYCERYKYPSVRLKNSANSEGPRTFMDAINADEHAPKRKQLPYYPFRSKDEWKLACFLEKSSLSVAETQEFLDLNLIKSANLSFKSAGDLRNRIEILPSGPQWFSQEIPPKPQFPTKRPVILYYRNPLECLQDILLRPGIEDSIEFDPYRLYATADKTERIYTEWLSGDRAWEMQSALPRGAALLGIILSTDETKISSLTGGRCAYPLFMSCANLKKDYRAKYSNDAFVLLALLPLPEYIHSNDHTAKLLGNRLTHECLDRVLKPLKQAAEAGKMLNDPSGYSRLSYTPIASDIVDVPESALLSCVGGKTSAVTLASHNTFGDDFRHAPRTAETTLEQLQHLRQLADPWNEIEKYHKLAFEIYRLNGVHEPFWRDWALAEPSIFLTPEPLHHWHTMFWSHDAKWCIKVVGAAEIDFRFSILQPHTGFRHFKEGISSLTQVTGREKREMQRYLIPVIAGAVSKDFMSAIRALTEFRYLAQAPQISEETLSRIQMALEEFH